MNYTVRDWYNNGGQATMLRKHYQFLIQMLYERAEEVELSGMTM